MRSSVHWCFSGASRRIHELRQERHEKKRDLRIEEVRQESAPQDLPRRKNGRRL